MRFTKIHLAGLFGLACAACTSSGSAQKAATNAGVSAAPEAVLYSRDGKPILDGAPIAGGQDAKPLRAIGEGEGGRASLLELYTKAVANRSSLAEEVAALRATLDGERKSAAEGSDERTALREELAKVSRERDALKAETLDLAARLTTAQIARLEAQKALLELQIDARLREEATATAQASAKDKKRAGGEHK
jgi:hypothetical protein